MAQPVILVIDDDDLIQDAVGTALELAGYEVAVAHDGAAALALLRTVQLHLILLDLQMPVMDGRAFAAAYRKEPGPHAPVVIVTSNPGGAETAAELGSVAYLAKPFSQRQLLEVVERHRRR